MSTLHFKSLRFLISFFYAERRTPKEYWLEVVILGLYDRNRYSDKGLTASFNISHVVDNEARTVTMAIIIPIPCGERINDGCCIIPILFVSVPEGSDLTKRKKQWTNFVDNG